jgi:hypothetical protein
MKLLIFLSMVWAAPPVKNSNPQDILVKESFSIAQTGVETETYRIQQLTFDKQDVFMLSKLVNGNIYSEKNIKPKTYQQIRSSVIGLAAIPNSDLCQKPVTVVVVRKGKETKSKICGEKENISTAVAKFTDVCKAHLGKTEAQD